MNVTLRMYQVLLFKFRRHLCKGSITNQELLTTPGKGFCVCGQFIASEGFGAGWFEAEQREIYVRANASWSMAGLCD